MISTYKDFVCVRIVEQVTAAIRVRLTLCAAGRLRQTVEAMRFPDQTLDVWITQQAYRRRQQGVNHELTVSFGR